MPCRSAPNFRNAWDIRASTRFTQLSLPPQAETLESKVATVVLSEAYAPSTDSAASALLTVLSDETATPISTA